MPCCSIDGCQRTQLNFGLFGVALPPGLQPISVFGWKQNLTFVQGVSENGSPAGKVWLGESQTSVEHDGITSEGLQEFLWRHFFSDPSQWWDNRRSKRTLRHPDFRHKETKHALWLNNWYKPAWVDSQLAVWDAGLKRLPEYVSRSGRVGPCEGNLELETCRKLCEDGKVTEAVDELNHLVQRGCDIPCKLFYRVLKRCMAQKDLILGRRIHVLTVESGYEGNAYLATNLICMYAAHRKLLEAMQVFLKVPAPDAHLWASIILAYSRHGQPAQAIGLYRQMLESTVEPDNHVFVAVLKACATSGDLAVGKDVHGHIRASAVEPDLFLHTCLVDMYAKCGSLKDAQTVFDSLAEKNVVTWNVLILGYAKQGMGQEALRLYRRMQQEGITPPSSVTFVCLLQACISVGVAALEQGKQLHVQIEEQGLHADVVVGSSLVYMYAKCGSLEDAQRVFESLPKKNVVTWTAMIAGYSQQGMGQEALGVYSAMQQEGLYSPDAVTFVCLLQACARVGVVGLCQGKQLHAHIEDLGMQDDVVVGATLVNMYSKCGSLDNARKVFDVLCQKNVVTWNTMIGGYSQQGMGQEALSLFDAMEQEGITPPDSVTFVSLLHACTSVGIAALHRGRQLHAQVEHLGIQADMVVGSSLVNMYAKCGSLEDARKVFDRLLQKDVVTWNAMIAGYAHQGLGQEALRLYDSMQQEALTPPDSITFVCLLLACACVGVGALGQGKQLHVQIEERGLQADVIVSNSLVNMYGKCGSLENAQRVFDKLPHRNVVTWTAMIAGYAQQGKGQEALSLYSSMQHEGITPPNSATFVCLLQACASVAALPLGKQLHAEIQQQGLLVDVDVGPSLVNMYAKCASLEEAQQVFDSLPKRDIVAWSALIAGYARQGDSEIVFDLVDRMRQEDIAPNGITFLSLLTVCSHVGLVDKGQEYFEAMSRDYGISPTIEHYTCMVDLLGRAGQLLEALVIVQTMPFQPNGSVWLTLLGACRKWSNVEVGRQAFESAVRLDEKDAAAYVLMSNIYAGAQMLEEAKEMQARRVNCRAWKEPGRSWTDMGGIPHSFMVTS